MGKFFICWFNYEGDLKFFRVEVDIVINLWLDGVECVVF